MSEVKPCGHINTGVPCYCETPSPSTRAEAAPGGLSEAVKVYQIALGKIDKMRWDSNGASDSRNFLEACMVASKAMEDALPFLAAPTPAPNRDAELKVIEAAKVWDDYSVRPVGRETDWDRARCDLKDALASLAQSEMKGEGKR